VVKALREGGGRRGGWESRMVEVEWRENDGVQVWG
jgi:hypothetical protein